MSGLSKWVGSQLANLDAIPSYAIVIIVCVMITTFTEVTSNTATATIFLPILASLVSSFPPEFVLRKCEAQWPYGWGDCAVRYLYPRLCKSYSSSHEALGLDETQLGPYNNTEERQPLRMVQAKFGQ